MTHDRIDRIKSEMAWEFARTAPPPGFPPFPDIPVGRYTSDEFYEIERRHLWTKVWVMAGRAEDIARPGDYMTFDELGVPILLVRGKDERVRAFYNTCQHRGAPVVRDLRGTARTLRCQYHSWTYDITDGALTQVPDERDFIDLCRGDRGLVPVACETWAGWIFVNQDRNAQPLAAWFGAVFDEMDQFQGEALRAVSVTSEVVPCNWKVTAEAFQEVYHFRHIHSRNGDTTLDSRGATMGLLPMGSSRMVTPLSRSAWAARGMHDWSDWRRFTDDGFADIPSVDEMVRSTSTAYGLFPNLITPVSQSGFPVLLFWPLDRRTTKLQWIHYAPKDWEGDELPPHWRKRLDTFDRIMEEDTRNMAPMQRSLESPGLRGVPISYPERRIRHFHEQIDRVIGPDRVPADLRMASLLDSYVESTGPAKIPFPQRDNARVSVQY